ncbi:MAG: ribbon-helix-helix protein, CopG family [Burkholderiales bacterium]|nr:ribbon-helix-helix protein, CopG family [Burkholderiales bacterium]
MAVSLRVPDDVKKRVDRLASAQDTTAHAFMLQAIRDKVDAEEARAAFLEEGQRRLARMKKSGKGIPAAEVFAYLDARAKGGNPARPKARKAP